MATATKASKRRVVLQEVMRLVNQMVSINEMVYQQDVSLNKTSLTSGDLTDSCNAILAGIGPATTTTGGGATIADKIVGILHDNAGGDGDGHVSVDDSAGNPYFLTNAHLAE